MYRYPTAEESVRRISDGRLHAWWSGHLGRRLVAELFIISAVFVVYRQIRFLTRNDTETAMANADRVVDFERRFHVFTERGLQDLVMHSHTVVAFLNRYYVTVHFSLTTLFIVWVYWRHQDHYRKVRNWFISVTLAALVIHVAYPLAPPRMLRDAGFVDTLQRYGPRIYSTDTNESIANQFAAMPSLHFGWAVMVAGAFISIKRTRRSLLALAHPAITLLAIVATANHYWLDAAVALVLVAAAAAVIHVLSDRRQLAFAMPAPAIALQPWSSIDVSSWSSWPVTDGTTCGDEVSTIDASSSAPAIRSAHPSRAETYASSISTAMPCWPPARITSTA